uniref:Uncharacterized protein n=1 Tax=Rhizophora mucronata TaxID=61149 RepID=A0A2P2LM36_RHIMU
MLKGVRVIDTYAIG